MLSNIRRSWSSLVLEGLAVLVGVLLAFWVESLGQSRSDRQRAEAHLEALSSELLLNLELIDRRIQSGNEFVAASEHYLGTVVLPGEELNPDRDAVTEMIERMGPPQILEYQSGALDDLLSGGGLPLVTDETVRQGVLTYARLLADEAGTQQAAEHFWSEQLGPYYFQYGSLLGFMPIADSLGLEARPPVVEAFVRSRHFSNLLAERRQFERRLLNRRVRLKAHMDSLSSLIR